MRYRPPQDPKGLVLSPEHPRDVLLMQPLLQHLHQQKRHRQLTVMAPEHLTGLVSRMPEVSRVLNQPLLSMSWKVFWRTGVQLQSERFNEAWVLQEPFKPALIPALANIPDRTGYRGRYRYVLLLDIRLPRPDLHPHLADRYLALGVDYGADLPELPPAQLKVSPERQALLCQQHGLDPKRAPILALCPGGVDVPTRRWDSEAFGILARRAIERGYQVWVIASRHDQADAERICDALDMQQQLSCDNLAGRLSWEDSLDLLALAQQVVSNDGPLAHIAAATPVPQVDVVLGASHPNYATPRHPNVVLHSAGLECQPCQQPRCAQGGRPCLAQLDIEALVPEPYLTQGAAQALAEPSAEEGPVIKTF